MNQINIVGRVGSDPKSITNGCAFSVAVNKFKKDSEPDWFNVVAFGKSGEFCTNYVTKGRLVSVSGRMDSNKKDDKTYWSLIANEVQLLDKKTEPAEGEYDPFA